jgi:hypothetical protein
MDGEIEDPWGKILVHLLSPMAIEIIIAVGGMKS